MQPALNAVKFLFLQRRTSPIMRSLLVGFMLTVLGITAPILAAQKVEMSIDASKAGSKVDRNIFG